MSAREPAPRGETVGATFAALRARGASAFIPYVTAGDPDLAATERFVVELVAAGASIVELGVPFSDPMADGPTNQRAAERALAPRGDGRTPTSLTDVLALVRRLRARGVAAPLVLFTYFNPVFRLGVERFAAEAGAAGVSAVLALDLPPEESGDYRAHLSAAGVDTVFLASPTTDPARLAVIDAASTGFVYYVARTGVTGAREALSDTLGAELAALRGHVRRPVAVGFGISTPAQARAVAAIADGVVVGSAIVQLVESSADPAAATAAIGALARDLVRAIEEGSRCS